MIYAQILYILLCSNKDIKGFQFGSDEYKITQFADDTIIILDSEISLLLAWLKHLEQYLA